MASAPSLLDEIAQHLAKTDLNSEKGKVLHVFATLLQAGQQLYLNSCFGKIFSDRIYNINGLKDILARTWHLDNMRITRVARNMYLIFYDD